ncbi:unnamed protein product, partial [Mesorhabditis spiculigera]
MGREWRSGWLLAVLLALVGAQQQAEDVQDVVIIGAGLAGLSAANRILDQAPSTKLLVLEAKEASGGRLLSHQMKTAQGQQTVDIGSQWIGPKHTALLELVQKFGLTAEVQPICGERIILSKNTAGTNFLSRRRKRSYQWSSLGTSPSISDVFSSSDLAEFGGESAAGFIKSGNLDSVDGDGIRRLLQVFYDAPDTTVSALQLLLTASSENSTIDDVLSEMGHGTGLRVKEGLGQLVSNLATRDGLTITYSSPVTAISQEDDGTQTITAGGKKYSAKQVIIAVPPAIAAGIDVSPALPQNLAAFLGSYKPRGFATYFTLTYAAPFWRENGNSGQIIYAGTGGDLLWLTTFDTSDNNGCAFEGTPGVLWGIAHFGSDSLNADQRYAAYVKVMAEAFPNSGDPLDHFDYQFYDDEYALGSVGTLPVLHNTDDVAAFFEAFNTDGPQLNQEPPLRLGRVLLHVDGDDERSGRAGTTYESTTPFVYETSSQYEATTPDTTVTPPEQKQYDFPYSTSTQYAPEDLGYGEASTTESPENSTLPDGFVPDLAPPPSNLTSNGTDTAYPDDLISAVGLNATQPSNETELNPTASLDTTNSTTPENTTDFDVSNVTSPNNATELDDSAFNATTPLTNSTDSGEGPEFARLTVLRDVQSVPQQDDMENSTSPTTEAFVYQTSSQYPPGAFDDNEPEASSQPPASSTTYAFLYQTSSQYPLEVAALPEATSVQPDLNTLLLADEPLVQLLNATTPEAPAATSNATESAEDLIQEAVQTVEQNIKKVRV